MFTAKCILMGASFWVHMTMPNGDTHSVNPEQIVSVAKHDGQGMIQLSDGRILTIPERKVLDVRIAMHICESKSK